jgi:hypothetical protein
MGNAAIRRKSASVGIQRLSAIGQTHPPGSDPPNRRTVASRAVRRIGLANAAETIETKKWLTDILQKRAIVNLLTGSKQTD